jgi:hypothetical protein
LIWAAIATVLTLVAAQDAPQIPRKQTAQADGTSPPAKASQAPEGTKKPAPAAGSARLKAGAKTPVADDVRMLTRDEMKKRKSAFLLPSGTMPGDRYNPATDWNDVPPWRQASYWGIRAQGQFFVYVVDCSGSMLDDDRLPRATVELRRSVFALQPPQKFEVVFYNHESIPMPGGPVPRTADLQTKQLLASWLRLIEPDGGTDPRLAVRQAISLRPDAVFLLSDGAFPEGTVAEVARLNTRKIPIHCVDLAGGLAGDHLKRIARESGGRYAARPGSLRGLP